MPVPHVTDETFRTGALERLMTAAAINPGPRPKPVLLAEKRPELNRFVDCRSEPRLPSNQPVTARVLGDSSPPVPAIVTDLSGRGLRLRLPFRAEVGAAIRIDGFDMILLGEVRYCVFADGAWQVGIELRHSLRNVHELAANMSQ